MDYKQSILLFLKQGLSKKMGEVENHMVPGRILDSPGKILRVLFSFLIF